MLLYEYHVLVLISFSHVRRNKRSAPPLNNRYPNFCQVVAPPTGPIITSSAKKYSFHFSSLTVVKHILPEVENSYSRTPNYGGKVAVRDVVSPANFWIKCSTFRLVRCTCHCRNNRTKYCTWKSTFIGTQLSHTFLSRFAASINYFLHLNWSFCRENKIHKYLQTQRM